MPDTPMKAFRFTVLLCFAVTLSSAQQQYTVTTFAGTGSFTGDGGPAIAAQLSYPGGVAVDAQGNTYIADTGNHRIRKIDASGNITTIAGNGSDGFSGDGGPAVAAALSGPGSIVVTGDGTVYFVDGPFTRSSQKGNDRVRRITPDGNISTVAGNGVGSILDPFTAQCKEGGDGAPALTATFCTLTKLATDGHGNFYVVDSWNNIREFTVGGNVLTLAGSPVPVAVGSGDGGPASKATFAFIDSIAADAQGNIYVMDSGKIRKIDANRNINLVLDASSQFDAGMAVDPNGKLFYAKANTAYQLTGGTGTPVGTVLDSRDPFLSAMAVNGNGELIVVSQNLSTVWKISAGKATLFAGLPVMLNPRGSALTTPIYFYYNYDLAVDGGNNVYFVDTIPGITLQEQIVKVTPNGTLVPILGPTLPLPTGDSGKPAIDFSVAVLAVDSAGQTIYFSPLDQIYKYDIATGSVSLYAGRFGASASDDGNGGPAIKAGFSTPIGGLALDGQGNLYVSETVGIMSGQGDVVRRIDPQGIIHPFAGDGVSGHSGDNGPAAAAALDNPAALAVDSHGNVYIAEDFGVRKVDTQGVITTVAGYGNLSFPAGDGQPGPSASLTGAAGIAVDPQGNLFISDTADSQFIVKPSNPDDQRIRMVDQAGIIHTVAGSGVGNADVGDGGPALAAELHTPQSMGSDSAGNIYFVDLYSNKIRKLTPSTLRLESAASFAYGELAVDSIASAYGSDLATSRKLASGTLGTTLNGTTATIHDAAGADHAAELFFVDPSQVNFHIPTDTAPGVGVITVKSGDGKTSTSPIQIDALSPGIFTLNGAGLVAANVVAAHADGTLTVSPVFMVQGVTLVPKPVDLGPAGDRVVLEIYGTGIRGAPKSAVTATINGISAHVSYAGAQGAFVGLDQINVQIPHNLEGAGDVAIVITAAGRIANVVRVTIR